MALVLSKYCVHGGIELKERYKSSGASFSSLVSSVIRVPVQVYPLWFRALAGSVGGIEVWSVLLRIRWP